MQRGSQGANAPIAGRRDGQYVAASTAANTVTAIGITGPTALSLLDTQSTTITFVGVGFDTSVSPGNIWRCCSGGGATATCVNVPGSSVTTLTEYTLIVDWSVSGTLTCSVQAGSGTPNPVSKTDNLSTSTSVDLGIFFGSTNLTAGNTTNLNAGPAILEQN